MSRMNSSLHRRFRSQGHWSCHVDIRKNEQILLASFCVFLLIPLLYIGRFADNNTFTSWLWVFRGSGILRVFFILVPGVLCAYVLSGLELSGCAAGAALFLLPAVAVTPLWSAPESIIDAARYFVQAASMKEFGTGYFLREWGNSVQAWTDLPLVPFLYGLLFSWLGESRIVVQIFNTVLFSLTAVLTMLIGRKLWDEETGLHAGILLLGMPYLLTQVPLMLTDVPTMLFLTLAIYAFIAAVDSGSLPGMAAASLTLLLAVMAKYSTWLMLTVLPVVVVIRGRGSLLKASLRGAGVLLLFAAPAAGLLLCRYDLVRDQIMLLRTYQWAGLGRWQESFVSTFLFQTHPFVALFALFGVFRALRERDLRFLLPVWFAVFVLVLQVRRIRYLIPLLPLLSLMAAYGLQLIGDRRVRRFVVLCVAASSLVLTYAAYLPFLRTSGMANLADAGAYLTRFHDNPVEVYALPQTSSSGSTFAAIPLLDFASGSKLVSPQEWPAGLSAGPSQTSSMRFTWEMRRPAIYMPAGDEKGHVFAVISSEVIDRPPAGLEGREIARFARISALFRYQTVVTIYKEE